MTARHATSAPAATPTPPDAHGRGRGATRHAPASTQPSARRAARAPAPDGQDSPMAREQRIRELAYTHYLQRGGADGHDLDDWLKAEAQVG